MLLAIGVYVVAGSTYGERGQSSTGRTEAFSIIGSTEGFPRDASGGWTLHYFGSNPSPANCTNLLNSTFSQGYTLETYSSSNAVKAGGLVCINIVLSNVNGTVVTWGHSDELLTGYEVVNSSGTVFDSFRCIPDVPPPGQGPGAEAPRLIAGCTGIWDTGLTSGGSVPAPGIYFVRASASYPGTRANSTATDQSSTEILILSPPTSSTGSATTTTSPCNAPGVYCGPGIRISFATLTSASTLGGNYSLLSFAVNGTYANLQITTLSIWLSNASSSEPTGSNGAHLVGRVNPTWSGKDGSTYSFDVPMTGFHAVRGSQCELWIDAYSARGPLKGDNWAMQNMTIG